MRAARDALFRWPTDALDQDCAALDAEFALRPTETNLAANSLLSLPLFLFIRFALSSVCQHRAVRTTRTCQCCHEIMVLVFARCSLLSDGRSPGSRVQWPLRTPRHGVREGGRFWTGHSASGWDTVLGPSLPGLGQRSLKVTTLLRFILILWSFGFF